MPFLTELVVESVRGTPYRILRKPLIYKNGVGDYIAVPVGFKTDYASIPKILRSYIDQDSGRIRDAAVLHDYLYTTCILSREASDHYFHEAMIGLGMPKFKAWIAWKSVRMFGKSSYKSRYH